MAGSLNSPDFSSVSKAEKARRTEKKASAKLRGRQSFNDQSKVDKIYQWVKENYEVEQRDARAEMAYQESLKKYNK
jgi:hypothetical protein